MRTVGRVLGAALASCAAMPSLAQDAGTTPQPLETIVVTGTRTAQSSFDLPMSIDVVGKDAIQQDQLQVNLSESLQAVPGIVVQNRQNYAQDLQISMRGFGARSTFGVRGIRVYVDGIPATMPDGQGQISHIDLGSAERIEVLRGPFSALYGNSAGGVISIFTEDGKPGFAADADFEYGSYDTRRQSLKLSGEADGLNYVLDMADFHTSGYREHSAAQRANLNAKLRYDFGDNGKLTLVANAVDMPSAQDPLGLTRAQFDTDPKQAGANADLFNTRKSVDQEQIGLTYRRDFGEDDTLQAMLYDGHRSTTQFQSIPLSTERASTSPGGVIGLNRDFWGSDVNWTHHVQFAGMTARLVAGFSYDYLDEARKGYLNFIGSTLGVEGALRRNETNHIFDFDQYAQLEIEPDPHWLIEAGVRNSRVAVTSHDHYIVPGNGDDSGSAVYHATTPVAGITWRASPALNLYVSYGQGFQTPTFDELSYRSTSGTLTGLNFALRPSRSENYEIGAKAALGDHLHATLAAYHIDTRDELAVEANANGRSVYQNVAKTSRDGIEAALEAELPAGFGAALSYTYLRATNDGAYRSCPGLPCVPITIPAGRLLAGVPTHSAYGELSWGEPALGLKTALELRLESRVPVNDVNADFAPLWWTANVRAGWEQVFGIWRLREFVRLENLFDRRYAGSVIVNESNGRFFEPAPGRAAYAGLSAGLAW